MCPHIVDKTNVSIFERYIMPDSLLLEGLGVHHCYFKMPHAGNSI